MTATLLANASAATNEPWCTVKLREIATSIEYGFTASASKEPVGPKFLRITDIQNCKVNWDTVPYCKADSNSESRLTIHVTARKSPNDHGHIIVFDVDEQAKVVNILHVFRSRQDMQGRPEREQ